MKVTMEVLVALINASVPNVHAEVEGAWEDYGARLWWETIIIRKPQRITYQALTPRQHKDIRNGKFTLQDAESFIDKMIERGW